MTEYTINGLEAERVYRNRMRYRHHYLTWHWRVRENAAWRNATGPETRKLNRQYGRMPVRRINRPYGAHGEVGHG